MIIMCGVAKEIWYLTDWASGFLVLELSLLDTVMKMLRLSDEAVDSIFVLAITHYFTHSSYLQSMPKRQAVMTRSLYVGQDYFGSLFLNIIPNTGKGPIN